MPTLTDPLGFFTLEFPDDWGRRSENGVTVLESPRGRLYVSGARHVRGRQPAFGRAEFLLRFLRSLGLRPEPDDVTSSQGVGCHVYRYDFDGDDACWSHYSITDDETVLLVSYTCRPAAAGSESRLVDELISSVRLFHSGPAH